MSARITILYYALWIAHPLLEATIAMLMVQRGLQRQFRFFFGYIFTQLISFALVVPVYWYRHNYTSFFFLYWVCTGISVVFGFGVIHEIFVDVFHSFHTLRDLGTVLFKWAGVVMLLVAGVVSVSADSSKVVPWMQAIITAQRCVRIIQVGMILFLLFFAHYLGVSRRQRSFGLALGFGLFAVVELTLIASWVGNHLGNPWMSIVNMSAYNLSLGVWVGYIALKSPVRQTTTTLLQPQRWEQSLSDIHHPLPANSLIPMFEGMVDRALSRAQRDVIAEPESNSADTSRSTANSSGYPLAARAGSKS